MPMYLRLFFRFISSLFKTRRQLVWENAVLRYQIVVLRRKKRRVTLKWWDRPILVFLCNRLSDWKKFLFVVEPETLIRWHRRAFQLYWGRKYGSKAGRPAVHSSIVMLIRRISRENPLLGAPRIHGELLKLGIDVCQSTVEKYMVSGTRRPNQPWKTFLHNHLKDVVAIDFFIVPTIRLKMLWALVVFSPDRRRILHVAVTENPSRAWTAQQLRNTFSYKEFPRFLLRDRDRNFWGMGSLGMEQVITAHKCPWQNGFVERVIGTIRRECTDHLIVLSERHLKRILKAYKNYYNRSRTHLSLDKDSPFKRRPQKHGKIVAIPKVGGLHHRYERVAA